MQEILTKISSWFMSIGIDQVVALILTFLGAALALSAVKNALKLVGAVVGTLCILYFIKPDIYTYCISFLLQLWRGFASLF